MKTLRRSREEWLCSGPFTVVRFSSRTTNGSNWRRNFAERASRCRLNIAEGYGKRRSARHFKAYLENALGSSNEMIVHLEVAEALEYLGGKDVAPMIDEYRVVSKLLVRLIEKWH